MNVRLVIGTLEKHVVEAAYDPATRTFRVVIDGQEAYRHGGSADGAAVQPAELQAGGQEVHTLIVEPPRLNRLPRGDLRCFRLWLDGTLVATVAVA